MPFYDRFVLELIYEVEPSPNLPDLQPTRIIGLDLGVNNLVATSDGLLIKGGVIKTINQRYNKQLAKYRALAAQQNQSPWTKRILRLHRQRTNKLADILHQTSRQLISYCQIHQIGTIVVGYNPQWKQQCNLGRRTNQNFIQIPFLKFVRMLEYKASRVGIQVLRRTEAYTSQRCSHCGVLSSINRHCRGLYQCRSCGIRLNADTNAACNIRQNYLLSFPSSQVVLRKAPIFPRGFSPDSGGMTPPVQNSYHYFTHV